MKTIPHFQRGMVKNYHSLQSSYYICYCNRIRSIIRSIFALFYLKKENLFLSRAAGVSCTIVVEKEVFLKLFSFFLNLVFREYHTILPILFQYSIFNFCVENVWANKTMKSHPSSSSQLLRKFCLKLKNSSTFCTRSKSQQYFAYFFLTVPNFWLFITCGKVIALLLPHLVHLRV